MTGAPIGLVTMAGNKEVDHGPVTATTYGELLTQQDWQPCHWGGKAQLQRQLPQVGRRSLGQQPSGKHATCAPLPRWKT